MISWRSLLLDNLVFKVTSVVLAVLIWHLGSQQETPWQIVNIPVGFTLPEGLVISNDHPNQIEIVARSHRTAGVDRALMTAVIDLPSAQSGTQVIQLTEKSINRPAHVEIDSITPSMIRLEIENLVSKTISLQPQYKGEPEEGFEVTGIRVLPSEIRVSGPASVVTETEAIRTFPVDVSGKKESVTQNAFVELDDLDLRLDEDLSLVVNIVIEEKRRAVRIPGVEVKIIPDDSTTRLGTEQLDLLGSVPLSWAEDLDPELFSVELDLTQQEPTPRLVDFDPRVIIPPEFANFFRLAGTRPEKVRARRVR